MDWPHVAMGPRLMWEMQEVSVQRRGRRRVSRSKSASMFKKGNRFWGENPQWSVSPSRLTSCLGALPGDTPTPARGRLLCESGQGGGLDSSATFSAASVRRQPAHPITLRAPSLAPRAPAQCPSSPGLVSLTASPAWPPSGSLSESLFSPTPLLQDVRGF